MFVLGRNMSRNFNPAPRERKKTKKPLPTLEELRFPKTPKISRPKKNDRQAIKRIAKGDFFWDKKRVERNAKRSRWVNNEAEMHANIKKHHLPKSIRLEMLKSMPSWVYDNKSKAFRAVNSDGTFRVSQKHFEELLEAVHILPWSPVSLKVWNLHHDNLKEVRSVLPSGSVIQNFREVILYGSELPTKIETTTVNTYLNRGGGLADGL